MNSSGLTALATSGNGAIVLLSPKGELSTTFVLVVTGTAAGFLSMDAGGTWGYVPGAVDSTHPTTLMLPVKEGWQQIQFKRVPGGSDVTGIWAWAA